MKKLILIFLFFGIAALYIGCSDNNPSAPQLNQSDQITNTLDKKPVPHITTAMNLNFVLPWMRPYPELSWEGTININGVDYYMKFDHLSGPPRDYSQVSPFEEYFYIMDGNNVVLAGPDAGVTVLANKLPEPTKYVMNGKIEVANEPLADWLGRPVHMSGVINWQFVTPPGASEPGLFPATAPGTFRIN